MQGLSTTLLPAGLLLSSSSAASCLAHSLVKSPGLACAVGGGTLWAGSSSIRAFADSPLLSSRFSIPADDDAQPEEPSSQTQDSSELKSVISVFHPWNLLGIAAKSIGFSCLLRFNVYILELLDHEQSALDAEARGEEPSKPPPFPDLKPQVIMGAWGGVREVAVRFVRRIYEHLAVWRLGAARASPFLRDGVLWVHHVLHPKHASASTSQRLSSFGFALLHANALLYAADCTVSVVLHIKRVSKDGRHSRRQAASAVLKGTAFHLGRCLFVLASTSLVASLASLAKPGLGTRVGCFVSDFVSNQQAFTLYTLLGL